MNNTGVYIQYSSTYTDKNLRYVSGMEFHDPIFWAIWQNKVYLLVSVLEYSRAVEESKSGCLISNSKDIENTYKLRYPAQATDSISSFESAFVWIISKILKLDESLVDPYQVLFSLKHEDNGNDHIIVNVGDNGIINLNFSGTFPLGLYLNAKKYFEKLQYTNDKGSKECMFKLEASDENKLSKENFFGRRHKTIEEAEMIALGNNGSKNAFDRITKILKDCSVDPKTNNLMYNDKALTSEFLISEIRIACIEKGCVSTSTICSSGEQAAKPHCSGTGPIKANSLIVADVYPLHIESGYNGDMTRTFIKGTPSAMQRKMVDIVKKAHDEAVKMVKPGIDSSEIDVMVLKMFEDAGFKTVPTGDSPRGYIHSLGHGLGMDVHETPSVSRSKKNQILEVGDVITIEPGLYYKEIGGCRIEDNYLVTENGCKCLSEYPYNIYIE